MDSFWDGIMVLLMKPNQNLAAMFKSLFSIRAPTSIHLGVSHSARLVEIADTLGDPPFGLLHRLSALAFSIFASLDHWAVYTLEQNERIRLFGDSPNGFGYSHIFIFSFFKLPLFLFAK
ncbi:hypothetical protein H5410_062026 [Solanum commersonii]|uniref:Uncharacterized protein n=1 Tax=Solanum commersonii TaxID=4109 RepID=A0A9J5WAF9_SOLCO|nr:hypothetical protein H5410_062026 [Solanum commersonii]